MNGEFKKTIENPWYDKTFLHKVPSFKLKYQTAESTHIDSKTIADKIVERLTDKKFVVSQQRFNSISFTTKPYNLIWKYTEQLCLGGGNFEIVESEKENIIVFKYFTNILNLLVIATVFLMVSVIQQASFATLVLGIFFAMIGLYQFTICKIFGKKMLREIVKISSERKKI